MKFCETPLTGAYLIEPIRLDDERGFFARTFCRREFEALGLNPHIAQCSVSYNRQPGTLRGLHFQKPPHAEVKLVRCSRGAIFDVIVDLRPESLTFGQWYAVELSDQTGSMLYIPEGCAHGFQSLVVDTEVCYQISEFHEPSRASGIRWNDSRLAIPWPIPNPILSMRDRQLASFDEAFGVCG